MKNFNIFGVHGKIQVWRGMGSGAHEKTMYRGDCLKGGGGGLGQFADLMVGGGLGKIEGGWVDTPMHIISCLGL